MSLIREARVRRVIHQTSPVVLGRMTSRTHASSWSFHRSAPSLFAIQLLPRCPSMRVDWEREAAVLSENVEPSSLRTQMANNCDEPGWNLQTSGTPRRPQAMIAASAEWLASTSMARSGGG